MFHNRWARANSRWTKRSFGVDSEGSFGVDSESFKRLKRVGCLANTELIAEHSSHRLQTFVLPRVPKRSRKEMKLTHKCQTTNKTNAGQCKSQQPQQFDQPARTKLFKRLSQNSNPKLLCPNVPAVYRSVRRECNSCVDYIFNDFLNCRKQSETQTSKMKKMIDQIWFTVKRSAL